MAIDYIFFASRDVMLTSYCVVSTSFLVLTGAVNCYPASMVNLIWFANEKCLSCQHLGNMGTCNGASCDPKTQPFCKLGVLVHCLSRTCESPTIPTDT